MPADSVPSENNSVSENVLGTSPAGSSVSARERTDSESSEKAIRFVLPSIDGSPPKVLTLNEVAHVFEGIQKMELAHEIALNPDFKLQPHEPPENSLEQRIKNIMHAAFWDLLREQLKHTPPCFDHALQLLTEIKECFPQILSQNNERTINHINEVLDIDIARQQAEKGVLDFRAYANFIIDIMAKSCAPVRDEAVSKLREIEDVVDTFKGILDTMTLMKIDMVNYLLDKARNDILANSAEFEREKFKQYLQLTKFGFPITEKWLKSNQAEGNNSVPSVVQQTIINAYWSLMDWEENEQNFPEVLYMDKERILKLSQRAQCLCLCASLISICIAIPIVSQRPDNRKTLAKQFSLIIQNIKNESDVPSILENVWEQVKIMLNEYLGKEDQPLLDAAAEELLKTQILQLGNKTAPVRQLMMKRLQNYFNLSMRTRVGQLPAPAGYLDYHDDLTAFATSMKRIVAYNHTVFGEYFMQILTRDPKATNELSSEEPPAVSTNINAERTEAAGQ